MDSLAFRNEIASLLRETPGVEFKGPGRGDDSYHSAKVIRAMLAMANRRDGGIVVVGVDEVAGNIVWSGLSDDQLRTWASDHLADRVAMYADPSLDFDLQIHEHRSASIIVIEVAQFRDVPIVCKRKYEKQGAKKPDVVLREGAIYVRPRRKPESVECGTAADLRDLLDLATDKRLAEFVTRAEHAGLRVGRPQPGPSDLELFIRQAGDALQ